MSGTPSPLASRSRVMRLLAPVSPPEVAQDSIQPMMRSLGRLIEAAAGALDSTTSTSPFGST